MFGHAAVVPVQQHPDDAASHHLGQALGAVAFENMMAMRMVALEGSEDALAQDGQALGAAALVGATRLVVVVDYVEFLLTQHVVVYYACS